MSRGCGVSSMTIVMRTTCSRSSSVFLAAVDACFCSALPFRERGQVVVGERLRLFRLALVGATFRCRGDVGRQLVVRGLSPTPIARPAACR